MRRPFTVLIEHHTTGVTVVEKAATAGSRRVTVPPHIVSLLQQHLATHVAPGADSLLFSGAKGGYLHESVLYRHWDRARRRAGRPDLRFHDLRHTGATLAAQAGATTAELQARLGHATPDAAMIYQHAARLRDKQLAENLSRLASELSYLRLSGHPMTGAQDEPANLGSGN